jgi:hypothetical protein
MLAFSARQKALYNSHALTRSISRIGTSVRIATACLGNVDITGHAKRR